MPVTMELAAYLDRIGYSGPLAPDLATLRALQRAHLLAIPYENLDVQLARRVTTDPAAAYDKIVRRGRGGWCYEMNGLLGWALDETGFKVTRLAGAVMREAVGDSVIGNHLVLLVDVAGEPWVADVGFGDGPIEPFPLRAQAMSVGGFTFRLEAVDAHWWRFHNQPWGGAKSFDFTVGPADPAVLADRCDWLQTAPESGFVQTLVAQRHRGDAILHLRGRIRRKITPDETTERLLGSADELMACLKDDFDLDVPEIAELWPKVAARHEQITAEREAKAAAEPA